MLYRAHRGVTSYAPENTMPAFQLALEKNMDYIETDPCVTKDGKVILMHDPTINRTSRNKDGSVIPTPVFHKDLTYDELLEYDAGIAFGEEFAGTKIPLLEELLSLAEGKDVIIALDKKIQTEDVDILLDVVEKYNTKVCFSTMDIERIKKIQERFPDALFDYDGPSTDEMLMEVTKLVKKENLVIWMYLDKPNFSWLEQTRKVSEETLSCAKRYARVGIGNVNGTFDTVEALSFCPDVVEQ